MMYGMKQIDQLATTLFFGIVGYGIEGSKELAGYLIGILALLYIFAIVVQKFRLLRANLNYEAEENAKLQSDLNTERCKKHKLRWMLKHKLKHPKKTKKQLKRAWKKHYKKAYQL